MRLKLFVGQQYVRTEMKLEGTRAGVIDRRVLHLLDDVRG